MRLPWALRPQYLPHTFIRILLTIQYLTHTPQIRPLDRQIRPTPKRIYPPPIRIRPPTYSFGSRTY